MIRNMLSSTRSKVVAGVLALLALMGIGAYIYQLANGLGVTGMNNATSWGLYIILFMFFVGLSAGGLIVASSASVFHIEKFKQVALPAIILSTVSICVAGLFILIDLGGIHRVWKILMSPNFISPLLWDMIVISLYLIINIIYLVMMKKHGVNSIEVARVSRFALPIAILVHSVTAWIFGLQIAKEGWYTAIMAPIFVASAMDSGLALLILALIGLTKAKLIEVKDELIQTFAGLLAVFIAVDAFFIGCELLTMAYPQAGGLHTLSIMATGVTAPFFWFEIIFGLAIPFLILVLAKNRRNKMLVMTASVLVILGVLAKRIWLLITAFVTPNIVGSGGITVGNQAVAQSNGMWSTLGTYAPTGIEIMIAIGMISLGVLGFMVLSNLLLGEKTPRTSKATATRREAARTA